MDILNVLILHSLGDPNEAPFFLKHQVFMLEKYCPENNYLYHDVALPLPDYIKYFDFDLIVLDVTLLCLRWGSQRIFNRFKAEYAFIKDSPAVKIAFPQDEYDCSEILDSWMVEWKVDIVYSVISDNWEILYPKFHKISCIKLAYTGYIDKALIDWPRKPFDSRLIDIGYRARNLMPYFGKIGQIKSTIAKDLLSKTSSISSLKTDIVVGGHGTLNGEAWLEFINNSKFTLGSNSGSSLLDPIGQIQREVRLYLLKNPAANFNEIEEICFPNLDGKYQFTAISPRVMEAALLNSCQILVEGSYSGLMEPWKNYIPIKADASNWVEVYEAMKDLRLVQEIIDDTRAKILDIKELRSEEKSKKIISDSVSFLGRKTTQPPHLARLAIDRYKAEMGSEKYERVWLKRRLRKRIVVALDDHPQLQILARKIYNVMF